MQRHILRTVLGAGLALISTAANAIPPGFTDTAVTTVSGPTALAFTPDGRMLITRQQGVLRIFKDGALLPTAALTFPGSRICTSSERGLLGIAVDPAFTTNHFIYVYYTARKPAPGDCSTGTPITAVQPVNRVSRFTLGDDDLVDMGTELILVDNIPSPNGNHNGGDLAFGKDGLLYISVGDGGCDYMGDSGCSGSNNAALDRHTLLGKILRITKDGGIPPSNPFQGAGTERCNVNGRASVDGVHCQETFAWGLRNPFRFAFDPNAVGTRFFINDVGQGRWEEIDEGISGADYGWNTREGHCLNGSATNCPAPPAGQTDPVFDYLHNAVTIPGTSVSGCNSITGGAFVPNGAWTGFDNAYLFSDYVCGAVITLRPNGSGFIAEDFITGLGTSSAVHMTFGPYAGGQALYYTNYRDGGQVRRVTYTPANSAPTAVITATPRTGPIPLDVTLDGTGSMDADVGDTLSYEWDFGDGNTLTTTTPTTVHTYTMAGAFTASLVVRDPGLLASEPATILVHPGNNAPVASIEAPGLTDVFRVGQMVTLVGSATDVEDGALADMSLRWSVLLHHDTHTHPYVPETDGNNIQFTAPQPEDLAAAPMSHLEIFLTATDSAGVSHTVTQLFQPNRVDVTLETSPAGLMLTLNGASITGPTTVTSWESYPLSVVAADQGSATFVSWSDGLPGAHSIITPATATTYVATFSVPGTSSSALPPSSSAAGVSSGVAPPSSSGTASSGVTVSSSRGVSGSSSGSAATSTGGVATSGSNASAGAAGGGGEDEEPATDCACDAADSRAPAFGLGLALLGLVTRRRRR